MFAHYNGNVKSHVVEILSKFWSTAGTKSSGMENNNSQKSFIMFAQKQTDSFFYNVSTQQKGRMVGLSTNDKGLYHMKENPKGC